jgi:hypothetical protein
MATKQSILRDGKEASGSCGDASSGREQRREARFANGYYLSVTPTGGHPLLN